MAYNSTQGGLIGDLVLRRKISELSRTTPLSKKKFNLKDKDSETGKFDLWELERSSKNEICFSMDGKENETTITFYSEGEVFLAEIELFSSKQMVNRILYVAQSGKMLFLNAASRDNDDDQLIKKFTLP